MMKMRLYLLFILLALIIQNETQAQIQPLVVPVATPVSGLLIMSGNPANIHAGTSTNLFLLDTSTGNVQVLVDDALTLSSPTFDSSGDRIAFFEGRVGIQLYQISTDNFTTVIPTDIEVIDTESWSPDGNKIASIHYDYITSTNKFKYSLNIVDIGSGVAKNLFSFMVGESLRGFPLPSTVDGNDLFLYTMDHALWNPVYEDWIAIQMSSLNPEILNIDGQVRLFSMNVLYNLQTQQLLSLDDLFQNQILTHSLAWSTDGQSMVLGTDEPIGSAINIVKVSNLHGTPNLSLLHHANNNREVIASWLGIDDLLVTVSSDPQTHDTVYSISQIINDNLYIREFFRLPDSQFATTSYPDFYLTAPKEQQYQLSCLFDQAQPTRLEIGMRVRVNFTNGTPLRLRTEPDFDASEIMRMPEGTEFTVIGGRACANDRDYYRFWQLQLDDGTVGWAAEANTTDYFIEPVGN